MIRPTSPITIHIDYKPYKAVDLPTDDDIPLTANSIILRHRHVRQQHGAASIPQTTQGPPGRPTKGVMVNYGGPLALDAAPRPEASVTSQALTTVQDKLPPSDIAALAPGPSNVASVNVPQARISTTTPGRGRQLIIHQVRAIPISGSPDLHGAHVAAASQSAMGPPPAVASQPAMGPQPAAASQPAAPAPQPAASTFGTLVDACQPVSAQTGNPLPAQSVDKTIKVIRRSHAIRAKREQTVWFESLSKNFLTEPLLVPLAHFGDLYVHSTLDAKQIWLRSAEQQWTKIDTYHPHPWLPGYQLHFIANGEPRWVTQDSLRTYQTRLAKRKRENDALMSKEERLTEAQRDRRAL